MATKTITTYPRLTPEQEGLQRKLRVLINKHLLPVMVEFEIQPDVTFAMRHACYGTEAETSAPNIDSTWTLTFPDGATLRVSVDLQNYRSTKVEVEVPDEVLDDMEV